MKNNFTPTWLAGWVQGFIQGRFGTTKKTPWYRQYPGIERTPWLGPILMLPFALFLAAKALAGLRGNDEVDG